MTSVLIRDNQDTDTHRGRLCEDKEKAASTSHVERPQKKSSLQEP